MNTSDIIRSIVIGLILLFYSVLIEDLNSKFKETRKIIKFLLFFCSFLTAGITMLFLISI